MFLDGRTLRPHLQVCPAALSEPCYRLSESVVVSCAGSRVSRMFALAKESKPLPLLLSTLELDKPPPKQRSKHPSADLIPLTSTPTKTKRRGLIHSQHQYNNTVHRRIMKLEFSAFLALALSASPVNSQLSTRALRSNRELADESSAMSMVSSLYWLGFVSVGPLLSTVPEGSK